MNTRLNWKVLAGSVAAAAVGLYLVVPSLVVAALPILALAICPLAMLLMMKGMHGSQSVTHARQEPQGRTDTGLVREERLAQLRRQQADLAEEISELERAEPRPSSNGSERQGPLAN